MKILYLSQERNIDLEKEHTIMYRDFDSSADFTEVMDFNPDILIEREFNDGKSKYPLFIEWVKANLPNCKRAIWLIDNHCNTAWHMEYSRLFDYAFVAISMFKPVLATYNKDLKVFWLPLCYPGKVEKIVRNKGKIDYDIVFVGRWGQWFPERTRLIGELEKKYGEEFFRITDYCNMEENLRKGIISFNCSLSYDMNFRVWESLANGVELVTNDVPDLHLIRSLPERINIYHSDEELFRMISAIIQGELANDVIKSQIWVQNHHCLIHRHQAILKMMQTEKQMEF